MQYLIDGIFRLPTIKRLFYISDFHQSRCNIWNNVFGNQWDFTTGIPSKIEY